MRTLFRYFFILILAALAVGSLQAALQSTGQGQQSTIICDGTRAAAWPTTSLPWDFVKGDSGGGRTTAAYVINPDPNHTGIQYSATADNPDAGDQAVRNLAENLGGDPIRMYEWVRNNVRTEFYYGCHRGAYMTLMDRAGNDIDQCALLGALLRAANITPTYRLDQVWVPRTAGTGANRVGAYDWLGVSDDNSARRMADLFVGGTYSIFSGGDLICAQMWITITWGGREIRFFPAIKPHSIGRKPNLDSLSSYSWAGATSAAGGGTGSFSGDTDSGDIRGYLTDCAISASDNIRESDAPDNYHTLSGAELARLPMIVPEIVTRTAPDSDMYPQNLGYAVSSGVQALSGIPITYCSSYKVAFGTVQKTFEGPELLGYPLAVEFDGNAAAILRFNGAELARDTSSNNKNDNIQIIVTYFEPTAYYGGNIASYTGQQTVQRQDAVAVVYSFGRMVDRLQRLLQDVSRKEADNAANVTLTDRLQIIGHQYLSQVEELSQLGAAYFGHLAQRNINTGLIYLRNGRPIVDIRIRVDNMIQRSTSAPSSASVYSAIDLVRAALEGTAIEQHSGAKSFGGPAVFDQATKLNLGGAYVISSPSELSSVSPSLANYSDTYIGQGSIADIQTFLSSNSANRVVLLHNSDVTYLSEHISAYLKIQADGDVGSIIKGAAGGVTTAPVGTAAVAPQQRPAETQVAASQTQPTSSDPVDLTTGAFLHDDIDLVLGNGDAPNVLRLVRSYNSARRNSDPAGMGRGFTHSYAMRLQRRGANDIDAQKVSCDEVLPLLIALRMAQDAFDRAPTDARSWLMGCTAATWAVDQQLNSRATVALGARSMEFVCRPDGSYAAPPNVTATLEKQGDNSHVLTFRNDYHVNFRASDGRFTAVTDLFNRSLTATYDGSSRLSTVTDAYARSLTFSYNGSGRLYQVADSTGRTVSYGRTPEGNFTFTDAEGKQQRLEMDSNFCLTKVVDARSRVVVENLYDLWNRVWQQRTFGETSRTTNIHIAPGIGGEIDPAGGAVWTYFDKGGRRIAVVDQLNKMAQWHYDGIDRLTDYVSPATPAEITSYDYDIYDVLTSVTNPAGYTRKIIPDASHRPWKVSDYKNDPDRLYTIYTYTAQHQVESITAPGSLVTTFEYDSTGRLWKHHPASYASGQIDIYSYDAWGNIDKITHPADAYTSVQDYDDYDYDSRGNLLQVIDRSSSKISYEYNQRRQRTKVIQWLGTTQMVTQIFYDDAGDIDYTLDASNRKIDQDHDALGHLTEIKRGPAGAQIVTLTNDYSDPRGLLTWSRDALNHTTQYAYYATQQLATVTDPLLHVTTCGYDADRRPATVKTPLGLASGDADYVTTTTWDARGLKHAINYPDGKYVDYTYDENGRITELANRLNKPFAWTYNDTTRTVTQTTPTGKTTTSIANTRGLPDSMQDPLLHTTTFDTYDAEGRLTQKTDGVGVVTYTYWPNGLPKEVKETVGFVVHTTYREYDAANRLSLYRHTEGTGSDLNYEIGYDYYPSGELKTITYPGSKVVTYTYDDFGRLWKVADWASPSRVTEYLYDDASRLTRINRANGTYRVQNYDAASQLTSIIDRKSDGTLLTYEELHYDADGRICRQMLHPQPAGYTLPSDDLLYDDDNRLMTWNSVAVTVDANGNMTHGPLATSTGTAMGDYVYDSRNRLTSHGSSGYRYNPDGLRIEITGTGAAKFVVDPNGALSRTLIRKKNDGTTTYYIYGIGLLYEITGSSTLTYHADHLGSTIALSDDSQADTDRWSYAPYGGITRLKGSADTPFQFHGAFGVQTDANGLNYMRARYYNPRIMRFCNADPTGFGGGLNWYAFAENNPISLFDPSGLQAVVLPQYTVVAKRWSVLDEATYQRWLKGANGYPDYVPGFWGSLGKGAQQGYYAWADGVNPFGNPYSDMGYYDQTDSALEASRFLGGVSQQAGFALATGGLFNAGSQSVFWSGKGAQAIADGLGTTLGKTMGGRALQATENMIARVIGRAEAYKVMDPAWRAGSMIYTMNAKAGFQAVIMNEGPIWSQVERPLLGVLGLL